VASRRATRIDHSPSRRLSIAARPIGRVELTKILSRNGHGSRRTGARDRHPLLQIAALDISGGARTTGFILISGLLLLVAFIKGWQAVAGLRWPFDSDHFRNIANAVTFRDGGILSDAHYAGVPAWYSPLTSALLALGSLITFMPIHRVGVQGGALLNLVTPLALCYVTARWFGRRVALLALVAYLFVIGVNYPSWAIASYSPWMYVSIYATGIFILALAAIPAALTRASTRDALVLGIAAGVVVLAHPAATMLLAGAVGVQFLRACYPASRPVVLRLARSASISLVAALTVSAPYWLPIMIRYQWRVVNPTAGRWTWRGELDSEHIWGFLRDFAWHWPMLVIIIGLPIWIAHNGSLTLRNTEQRMTRGLGPASTSSLANSMKGKGASILATWTILAFLGLTLEVYRDSAVVRQIPIPEVPAHHYLLYLSVALCIWFGVSLNAIVQAVLGHRDQRWGIVAVTVLVAAISVWTLPSWKDRSDFVDGRAWAQAAEADFDGFAVVDWIRANTKPDETFLVGSGTWDDVLLPGLAGRKSVNINIPDYSNPFVNYSERQDAATRILKALRTCQLSQFERLARPYGHVRYIISQSESALAATCPGAIRTVYRDKAVNVQRILPSTT
jgi:hypothetical protein